MIVLCESCQTRFRISDEALGTNGRMVRCSRCGHQWLATISNQENNPAEEPTTDEPSIDEFVYHASLAKRKLKEASATEKAIEPMTATPAIEKKSKYALWRLFIEEWGKSPTWFKWVSLLITIIAIITTFIGHSTTLVHYIPQAYKPFDVYCADGLTLEGQQIWYDNNPNSSPTEGTRFTLQGTIVNRSNTLKHVPKLRLALLNIKGKKLGAQTLDLGDTWISPGQSVPIYHKLSYPTKEPMSLEISIGNRFELWFR